MNTLRTLVSSAVLIFIFTFGVSFAFGQITPSADSYTNSAAPTTNYGANVLLDVDGATQAAYIQFNLASIPTTYTSADIAKATLKLYVNTVPTAGSFNVDYVNGSWVENTITHSLSPALGTTIAASVPITTVEKNQFILIDVTAAVQAWLSGTTNDGIALVANGTFNATFDSKESTSTSHAPELDVVFAGGGGLAGVTTAAGSGLTGGGTSGTLNLGLLTSCASGQVLQWSGTAWACATPKGSGTVTKVASGAGLTGGPITGSGTLSIATGGVTNAMLATSYAQLGAANTFAANQTLNGTLTATSSGDTIVGNTNSAGGFGVLGGNTATTGTPAIGVYGLTFSPTGIASAGTTFQTIYYFTTGPVGTEGATNSATGYGVVGINGATTGTAVGVYGNSSSTTGYGVEGNAAATTATNAGVLGTTGSPYGYGVEGTGPVIGVYGIATMPDGAGVQGLAQSKTGVADGVAGAAYSPEGYGVYGSVLVTTGTTAGVYGTTQSPTGFGVEGANAATSGNAPGVYGTSASSSGYGVEGAGPTGVYGEDTSAEGNGYGVYGTSFDGYGVYGTSEDYGVYGTSSFGFGVYGASPEGSGVYGASDGSSSTGTTISQLTTFGVWGDTGAPSGDSIGIAASADSNTALEAANADSTGSYPTMLVENYTASANTHFPVFKTSSPNTYSGTRHCIIDTSANVTCTGVLSGSIQGDNGKQTAVYAMQSAENWLEDAGSGQLSNGSARIELDPAFAQTVNAGVEYHVFLTPNGDSRGLYVGQKTATSFEVHEQGGGTSSIAFDYRIMAKRKGYENVRLEDLTERFKEPAATLHKTRAPRPPAKPRSVPAMAMLPMHPLVAPRPIEPMLALPKAVPSTHASAVAAKPEVNQK